MAYNRDLQTDKETLLPTMQETADCLLVAALAVRHATFDTARCATEAGRGYQNATDLADLLVAAGVPFRDAHGLVGRAVNRAIELGVELQDLPRDEQRRLLPQLDVDLQAALAVRAVLDRRNSIGGTAPERVRSEAARWRAELDTWTTAIDEDGSDSNDSNGDDDGQ
jgi:argininosuccinate lyase